MVRVHSGKEGKSGVTVIMSLFFVYIPSDFPWLIFLTFFRGWSGFLLQLLKLLKPEYLVRNCFASLHFSLFISIVCLVWITWCISPTNNFYLLIWGEVSWGISCIICRLVIRMFVLTFPHPFPIVKKKNISGFHRTFFIIFKVIDISWSQFLFSAFAVDLWWFSGLSPHVVSQNSRNFSWLKITSEM